VSAGEHSSTIGGALLSAAALAWISAAVVVATAQRAHWSDPIVLGLIAAGGLCLVAALVVFAGPRRRAGGSGEASGEARAEGAPVLPPTATLSVSAAYDFSTVVCVGIDNPRREPIEKVSINFCVPDYVSELVPSDHEGDRTNSPEGRLLTSPEILNDDDGKPCGNGIKYWSRTGLEFPGRWNSMVCYRMTMNPPRVLPVRATLSSPDLDEPIELHQTFRPQALHQQEVATKPVAPTIECRGEVEKVNDEFVVNGRLFRDNFSVWLYVKNLGPTAEFSIRFANVQGVPASWGTPYGVRQASWEGGQPTTRPTIDGHIGERRVKVANVSRDPWAFWFYTTENGVEECGNQLLLEELNQPFIGTNINFEIEIANQSTAEKLLKRGFLAIVPSVGKPFLRLQPRSS
jgi:hypothetical protein